MHGIARRAPQCSKRRFVDSKATDARRVILTVLVAALGYFVDIYDLVLFLVVRVKSLRGIGVSDGALLDTGVLLLNLQMIGMLLGGILWGILGDRRGRVSVLFGSILLYSLANLGNAFVHTVPQYAALRLVAGLGLAGELGAGITLVSEILSREGRGYGTTIVSGLGLLGAVAAALVGGTLAWQTAYLVGGTLGLSLLALRLGLHESGLFRTLQDSASFRGDFLRLFSDARRVRRYLAIILAGVPIWFATSILVALSPEMAKSMGLEGIEPGRAVMLNYIGGSLGDFASGLLSQLWRSRKRAMMTFLGVLTAAALGYFTLGRMSALLLYAFCALLGIGSGYWAVFVTVASEQFGTNLRATAATTIPNFVRGAVVLLTLAFQSLKASLGVQGSAIFVGALTLLSAIIATRSLSETFGRDLDFVEE